MKVCAACNHLWRQANVPPRYQRLSVRLFCLLPYRGSGGHDVIQAAEQEPWKNPVYNNPFVSPSKGGGPRQRASHGCVDGLVIGQEARNSFPGAACEWEIHPNEVLGLQEKHKVSTCCHWSWFGLKLSYHLEEVMGMLPVLSQCGVFCAFLCLANTR